MRLTAACPSARAASGAAAAASALAITVRRLIMAASPWMRRDDSAPKKRRLLKKPLRSRCTPGQGHQRHVGGTPLADRFPARALEGVLDRLGLADRDMQTEQRGGDRERPFVEAQIAEPFEQDGASEDDQGVGEDEVLDLEPASHAKRVYSD